MEVATGSSTRVSRGGCVPTAADRWPTAPASPGAGSGGLQIPQTCDRLQLDVDPSLMACTGHYSVAFPVSQNLANLDPWQR